MGRFEINWTRPRAAAHRIASHAAARAKKKTAGVPSYYRKFRMKTTAIVSEFYVLCEAYIRPYTFEFEISSSRRYLVRIQLPQ
eukprot:SAG31_NODE_55_length_29938_cov_9.154027_10_plen_83_part_00